MVPTSKNISIVKPKAGHSLVCVWPCKVLFCCCDTFQIISRCDVALLQEVRDSKEQALPQLVNSINRWLTRENWVAAWSHQCSSTQLSFMTTPNMETVVYTAVSPSASQVWHWTWVQGCGQWEAGQVWLIPGAVCICLPVSRCAAIIVPLFYQHKHSWN